jgi:hypothetical protein
MSMASGGEPCSGLHFSKHASIDVRPVLPFVDGLSFGHETHFELTPPVEYVFCGQLMQVFALHIQLFPLYPHSVVDLVLLLK